MVSVLQSIFFSYDDVIQSPKDPEVDTWMFMSSPVPVVGILIAYLAFIFHLGPKWMKNKTPFEFRPLLIVYNFLQVLFSLYICSRLLNERNLKLLAKNVCVPSSDVTEYAKEISVGAWYYFVSKIVDLLDTVFFVLRKKDKQITFLHVYHHVITCLSSWAYLKYLPGEQGVIIGFLNATVHVVMYSYYMISAMGPKYAKYLWWKKYMTVIQLVQFFLMLTYLSTLLLVRCTVPKGLTMFMFANVVIFIILFSNFYREAYKKKKE